jgi:antitoxin PrlF
MSESTVTTKGQVTIPADIRKAMGLEAQDRVVFTSLLDGTVVMRAKTRSVMDLKGLLKRPKGAAKVAVDDMQIGRD